MRDVFDPLAGRLLAVAGLVLSLFHLTNARPAGDVGIDGDLGVISCERDRLQLLENLFRNSIEHGATNGRSASDEGAESADPAVTVTVRRTDGGSSSKTTAPESAAGRQSVFETGYTTSDAGTGFELNIVQSIAEARGWDVSVGESPAGGARFEFTGLESTESAPGSS